MMAMKIEKRKFTDDEKIDIVRQYIEGMESGKTGAAVKKEYGIVSSQIYGWKKKFGIQASKKSPTKVKRTPYLQHIEVEKEPSKIACIIGSPQEIAEVLKGMR